VAASEAMRLLTEKSASGYGPSGSPIEEKRDRISFLVHNFKMACSLEADVDSPKDEMPLKME
jgi:hypothetical protein